MSVSFVLRSHFVGPAGKHVRRLDADTVLDWFRGAWGRAKQAEDVSAWLEGELGTPVDGLASLFEAARDRPLPAPRSARQLGEYLDEHLCVEGGIRFAPHAIQVLTNDDELELAYVFLDDAYLKRHPGRAAYLLHDGWKLPATAGREPFAPDLPTTPLTPRGPGPGSTYLAFLAFHDSLNLTDLDQYGPYRIDGVRVPQLAEYLAAARPDDSWPFELKLIRSQLPPAPDLAPAFEAASRFPIRQALTTIDHGPIGLGSVAEARASVDAARARFAGRPPDYDPAKSALHVADHLAQLCPQVGWKDAMFHQWIIFDDLWAGEYPDLAAGILRYANRWDVLTA